MRHVFAVAAAGQLTYPTDMKTSGTTLVAPIFAGVAYAAFVASMTLLVLAHTGLWQPLAIARPPAMGLANALLMNVGLLLAFGVHHSIMARSWAKAWLIRVWPPGLERSLYVLSAAILMGVLAVCWQPMEPVLWRVSGAPWWLMTGFWVAGLSLCVAATFAFDHAQLFGLRQAWCAWCGVELDDAPMSTPWLYRQVRHPMQLGMLVFLWSQPVMTGGQLMLAAGMTGYMLVGLLFEERDLVRRFGDDYRSYQRQVPMLIPGWRS